MKNKKLYLQLILERISKVEAYLETKTKKDFLNWDLLQSALVYNLQMIKRLSLESDLEISDISWSAFGDLDDKSDFGYMRIDLNILWKLVKKDLPKLKKRATKIEETNF